MKQSKFVAIRRNLLQARENVPPQVTIGFGFILIGWKIGTRGFNQSLRVAIAVA